ncbi:HD family phosphohydrolase [Brachyspira aalborgi]|jgi:putative nucleotidyltransferase with HDIG domain|uniref:HDIG domain-containing protein n=1 Tax=Brachyspira aalborgi TaxID=29522 RepID=A0AB38Q1C4_9SPIR|nr:HDIG domain-containing metalloprotein [Brachyspira aalborgi]TXJ28571.1 HDIG domain-containing protein [Brachyspira aalborgi]TXJ34485.1 HDIG domain-containing protein [Brachyspira aalborgi]TXJ45955.1 HDIG domain-containing protein [Brachyspira aalborgi]CCY77026.1 metal dependent phosphohydrolase [Brachyspira sp. CAG:700]
MNTNKKIMKSVINKTPNIERISQLLIAIVLYAFTLVLVFPSYMQKITIPPIGETVEESLILKRTIKYKNREETDKLINYSKANIRPIFDMPAEIKENTISKIGEVFSFMRNSYENSVSNDILIDDIYNEFSSNYNLSINKSVFSNAIISDIDLEYENKVKDIISDFLERGIISRRNLSPETIGLIQNNGIFVYKFHKSIVEEKIVPKNRVHFLEDLRMELGSIIGAKYRELNIFNMNTLSSLINAFLVDNLIYNSDRTQAEIDKVSENIEPVYTTIKAGYPILEKGERITEEKVNLLRYILNDNNFSSFNFSALIGQMFFILLLFISLGYIIFRFRISFYTNFKNYLLFCFEYIFIMTTAYICSNYISNKLIEEYLPFYIYTFIPMFAILNSLLGAKRGISSIVTICITVLAANMTQAGIFETFSLFIGSIVVSIISKRINNRNGVLLLGFYLGIYLSVISLINMFLINDIRFDYILFALSFVSGLIQAILVMIILPVCEYLLETASIFKLQELADLNNPLLRQLQMNAPGTYHHSINMANLVEIIAEEIGEDGRLACVSAYYHDIGKTENPLYFIENTNREDNIHLKLKPTLSASIVKSHVRFGVEIAKKYKLPKEVIAAIKEHHGTSLIKYFYVEAYKENPNVDISLFTYPGPRPQSKITAILMILDSIEAASRTIEIPTRENLERLIENIVNDKMAQGELNDSGLTLKDIEIIKRISFQKIIVSLHERIKYPELPEENEKDSKNAKPNNEKNNNGKTDADKKEKYKVNDKKDIKKLPMKYNNEKNSIKYKDNSKKEKEIKEVVKK